MCPLGALLSNGNGGSAVWQEFYYYCTLLILRLEFFTHCVWIVGVIIIIKIIMIVMIMIIIVIISTTSGNIIKNKHLTYLEIMYNSPNTD